MTAAASDGKIVMKDTDNRPTPAGEGAVQVWGIHIVSIIKC